MMARKADSKRRRKKRIGKTGRESVFEITSLHLPSPRVGLMRRHRSEQHCNTSNMQFFSPRFLSGSFRQRPRDEPRTQTEEGRKRNQYVCRLMRAAHSPVHHHTAPNCKPLFPDSFKNSASPSSDSPLSAEKEKGKRSKSSSKEKAESVKPERTSSGGKKVAQRHHL